MSAAFACEVGEGVWTDQGGYCDTGKSRTLHQGNFGTCVIYSTARALEAALEETYTLKSDVHELVAILKNTLPKAYVDDVKENGTTPATLLQHIANTIEARECLQFDVDGTPLDVKFCLEWQDVLGPESLAFAKGLEDGNRLHRCVACGEKVKPGGMHARHAMRASHTEGNVVVCDNSWNSSDKLSVGPGGHYPKLASLTRVGLTSVFTRAEPGGEWENHENIDKAEAAFWEARKAQAAAEKARETITEAVGKVPVDVPALRAAIAEGKKANLEPSEYERCEAMLRQETVEGDYKAVCGYAGYRAGRCTVRIINGKLNDDNGATHDLEVVGATHIEILGAFQPNIRDGAPTKIVAVSGDLKDYPIEEEERKHYPKGTTMVKKIKWTNGTIYRKCF